MCIVERELNGEIVDPADQEEEDEEEEALNDPKEESKDNMMGGADTEEIAFTQTLK